VYGDEENPLIIAIQSLSGDDRMRPHQSSHKRRSSE
jgi:hypothetical protein